MKTVMILWILLTASRSTLCGTVASRVSFLQESYTVFEDAGLVTVCVRAEINSMGTMNEVLTVSVTPTDATARQGEDYEQPFPYYFNVRLHTLGSSTTCYNITLIADNIVEENKVFTLSLSVTEPALGFPLESDSDNAFVTIVNDDRFHVCLPPITYSSSPENEAAEVCATVAGARFAGRNLALSLTKRSTGNCVDVTETSQAVVIAAQPGEISMLCINVSKNNDLMFLVFLSSEDQDVVIVNHASVVVQLPSSTRSTSTPSMTPPTTMQTMTTMSNTASTASTSTPSASSTTISTPASTTDLDSVVMESIIRTKPCAAVPVVASLTVLCVVAAVVGFLAGILTKHIIERKGKAAVDRE